MDKTVAKIDEEFIKNHDENGDIVDKVDIEYHKELHDLHIGFPFLPEKMDVNGHNKLLCRYNDKKNCVAHIKNIKQALKHGVKLK